MSRFRNRYSRGIVGLPSALLVVGWAAIWLVWPTDVASHTVRRTRAETTIRYASVIGDPYGDAYVRFAGAMLPPQNGDSDESLLLSYERQRIPPFRAGDTERPGVHGTGLSMPNLEIPRPFSGQWLDAGVFRRKERIGARVEYVPLGTLAKYGLELPKQAIDELAAHSNSEWEVVLYVDVDDAGRVAHVFVEESSGDRNRDASIERAVGKGKAVAGSSACSGRIRINSIR